jgi:ribosomal protein L37E
MFVDIFFQILIINILVVFSQTKRNRTHNWTIKEKIVFHEGRSKLKNDITTDLKSTTNSSPHVLIELSEYEWERVKDNCVHCEGLFFQSTKKIRSVSWEKAMVGKNLRFKKNSKCDDDSNFYREIDLNRTKSNMMMITALRNECQIYIPSLIVSSSVNNNKP